MSALNTLFPVFFMMILGFTARKKQWVSAEQKDGVNHVVFNVLFPVLIFNVLLNSTIEFSSLYKVAYVLLCFTAAMLLGKLLANVTGKEYGHISKYMMATCEGGNVALPLYTSIVGMAYASNTIIFDIAGTIACFIIMPILVTRDTAGNTSMKELITKIVTNSFVIACFSGILLNVIGFPAFLQNIGLYDVYSNTISMMTNPIVGMILFVIGYNFEIDTKTLGPILRFISVRLVYYILIILGFFLFFSVDMKDKIYLIGVLIYFTSPTGFGVLVQIDPVFRKEEEKGYASAILSLQMVISLIVYTGIVLFLA